LAAVPSIGRAARIEGALASEADLTRALYERYANQIFRYCLHQLGSREEAEDAVQSTFLNAFRGLKRGVVPELESAWLFKIAHNVCLSRRRTSWRRGRVESPTDFDVVEELTPAPSRRADELIGLQDVLEQMPEGQRRAILLREWQGLSYREIGEELELSQAAVETLIFRARRSLAAGLDQPPETKKRKLVRGADLGNLFAGIKSLLLGGGAAAKIAATVAAVSAGTVVAAAPMQEHRAQSHEPATAVTPVANAHPAARSSSSTARPAASVPAAGAAHAKAFRSDARAHESGTLAEPGAGTVATSPAERAPVATRPAFAPPAQATPPPAAGTPHQAAPAPAANAKPKTGSSTTTPKAAGTQGGGRNGSGKRSDAGPPSSNAGAVKGSNSGSDSKGSISTALTRPVGLADAPTVPASAGNGEARKADSGTGSASMQAPVTLVTPPATVTLPVPVTSANKDK
jgi:RNA polymerase sigma factor (sigma-70 family)